MIRRMHGYALSLAAAALLAGSGVAAAQSLPKPEVGPEKPFTPPPRVERTLANGLRVVAVRYGTIPKLSAILTVKAGLAVDPPAKAGLAQFVAEAAQEGTTSRTSEQLKREVFALGASLGFRGAGFHVLPDARADRDAAPDA